VTLTDFNPLVLHNLRYNAALNDPARNAHSMPAAHALLLQQRAHAAARRQRRRRRAACAAATCAPLSPATSAAPAAAAAGRAEVAGGTADVMAAAGRAAEGPPPGPHHAAQPMLAAELVQEAGPRPHPLPPMEILRVAAHDWSLLLPPVASAPPPPVTAAAAALTRDASEARTPGELAPSRSTVVGDFALLRADEPPFDVVLASDAICCDADAHGVAATLARHLRRPAAAAAPGGDSSSGGSSGGGGAYAPGGRLARFGAAGGVAVLLLPPPFARYGVDALAAALDARGLAHSARPVDAAFTHAALGGDEPPGGPAAGGSSDASHLVVAGGRERELQLWVVSWPRE
jgi:hypothetical protein